MKPRFPGLFTKSKSKKRLPFCSTWDFCSHWASLRTPVLSFSNVPPQQLPGVTHSIIPGVSLGLQTDGPLKGRTGSTNLACWAGSSARKISCGIWRNLHDCRPPTPPKRLEAGHTFGASQPLMVYSTRSAPENEANKLREMAPFRLIKFLLISSLSLPWLKLYSQSRTQKPSTYPSTCDCVWRCNTRYRCWGRARSSGSNARTQVWSSCRWLWRSLASGTGARAHGGSFCASPILCAR